MTSRLIKYQSLIKIAVLLKKIIWSLTIAKYE